MLWAEGPPGDARAKITKYKEAAAAASRPVAAPMAPVAPPDRNDLLDAFEAFTAAGAENTTDEAFRLEHIELLTLLGYHDLAAEQWECVVKERPADGAAWLALGRAWAASGPAGHKRGDEALQQAVKLLGDGPDKAEAWAIRGWMTHQRGLHEAARDAYARALELAPGQVRAVIGAATLDARAGKITEASAALDGLKQAAQPYDVETRLMLRRALHDFEAGRGVVPDEAGAHAAYSRLLYRAGRLPDAALAARRASDLNPGDVESLNFLASILMQMNQTEQAAQVLEKSLAARPDQPGVAETLKRLRAGR